MFKRETVIISILICLLFASLLVTSCSVFSPAPENEGISENDETPIKKEYYIQYVIDGAITDIVTVEKGQKVSNPLSPTKAEYVFDGWYKDSSYTEKWDFDKDTVQGYTNLYGRFFVDGVKYVQGENYFIWGNGENKLVEICLNGERRITNWYIFTDKYGDILMYIDGGANIYPVEVDESKANSVGYSFKSYEELIQEERVFFLLALGIFYKADS